MMRRPTISRLSLLAAGVCLAARVSFGAITVFDDNSAVSLVNNLVGPGVTVVGVPTLVGQSDGGGSQQGRFSSTPGIVGFNSGIILSTGYAKHVIGPNTIPSKTKAWNTPGDPQLDLLVGAPVTEDANILQFQFQLDAGVTALTFRYVFASEEYNEFVGSPFNDVFGFYVDGTNVGVLPVAGNPPVSVNTVNLNTNSQFYRNNDFPNPTIDTEMDGLTVVLEANVFAALNQSLQIHTMKLAIADSSDADLDSVVMLQAGSFSAPEPASAIASISLVLVGLLRRVR